MEAVKSTAQEVHGGRGQRRRSGGDRFGWRGDVRGQGLLLGVELVLDRATRAPAGPQARWLINELCRRGVLVGLTGANRKARNVLKIRPPMIFDEEGLGILVDALDGAMTAMPAAFRD